MNFNSLKYLFTEGLKNLLNNVFMALASIGVLTACLLIVGASVLFKINLKNIISFMGQQSTVVVYLKDNAKQEQIDEFMNLFKNNENINSVDFTTKEKALENFAKKYNNGVAFKALTTNNVLPPSINIHIKNVEEIEEILKIANDPKYQEMVEETKAPTKYTNAIKEFNKTTNIFGSLLILALVAASLVIISNTIRATIFARRREIAIMKQVGATDSFVRFPFLIEGASIGVISAFFAFCLTAVLYKTTTLMLTRYSSSFLNSMFSTLVPFKDVSILMSISFLFCGVLAGAIGSIICLFRYLKI